MKNIIFKFLLSLLFISASLVSTIARNPDFSNLSITEDDDTKDTTVYAYVVSIKKDAKGVLVLADFIQYYTNEEAVIKAKERGDADTLYKNGKIMISIPGNYYIVNTRKKIRPLYLSKMATYHLRLSRDRQHPISENTFNSFFKIYMDSPFILHLSGNEIVRVEELLLPWCLHYYRYKKSSAV